MDHIRLIVELLKELGVEHPDDKVETAVVVGNDRIDGGFPLSQTPQLHLIVLRDAGQRVQVELLQTGDECDLDGFQRFSAS